MNRILVTGGAGFIGSHTCITLLESGYDLLIIDSFINSSEVSLKRVKEMSDNKNINYLKGDIRNLEFLDSIFSNAIQEGKPIDAVIHFAGLKSVSESTKIPLTYWDVNVVGSIALFSIMRKYKCYTIVFSSSATIYGNTDKVPIKEDSLISPINPYGESKATVEKILSDLSLSAPFDWRIACLRYFNPVGAHPSGRIGEDPLGIPNNLFPYITNVAGGQIKQVEVFGNDWPTQDGTGVRDYVHVLDLAEAHKSALECLFAEPAQLLILNLGNGFGLSVLEIINTFSRVNNCEVPYVFAARRPGDIAISYADIALSKARLNWYPKRSIEDMCRDTWRWKLNNPIGYRSK
ncbi:MULTISPECIES: UDP-glucose 4-epimerase GalE [Prochlorococcus]|uniref:UDP-glucose 4-epimerase n=1 Tax=Prochlorococcus marinus (strain SARG / CCMP1375 / SS120) TaxID=167539 RepID=Q7VAY9_PROMA|nr:MULTISPECIES: UDP-glucose 4-epimerase GalE [Prochlorococcus]AAQ00358.1 UDP-glucose 4-epimerase [Prochlorococcus marinus subsp. marinus str. CCMP1375]KGG14238.1 UDP-glucose 4-epimerase [Prochlorococcus marinus str. LG]KGG22190.1 UDP-glucose 4-epimerase [Prochlorococcus marinus str. SS2]KGG24493.1 UDP-glucose 4-epimerase [Prochlorococcus marinus str. SS35]KGG33388.1 UDP-glucose 4-epimerase [Prochlorococcus marinus str. SS51]